MPYDPPTMKAKKGTAFVRKWFPRRARLMTPAPPRARRSARRRGGAVVWSRGQRSYDASGTTRRLPRSLESVTDETRARRREAASEVEAMIDREFDHLLAHYKRARADEVIASMYENAERMKHRELSRAVSKLEADGLTDDQRAVVESLADTLVSQLLAAPTKSLRDAAEADDWTTINSALRLFDPSFDGPSIPEPETTEVSAETRHALATAVREHLDD